MSDRELIELKQTTDKPNRNMIELSKRQRNASAS